MNEMETMSPGLNSTSSDLLLEPFFAPKGVAVIGASPTPGNQGKRIVESLLAQGFKGKISAVHPRHLSLLGCNVVADIKELHDSINLAIATVSAAHALELIEPLAKKGIHSLIVIGGGFAETGEEGKTLQNDLKKLGNKWGVRIIGPNCLGTFSAFDQFNTFFLSANEIRLPDSGSIAIISQSGAFLSTMLDQLAMHQVGVHRAINFGNRIDIGECEALEAFAADPRIKVIGIYLESVQNGKKLFELARGIAKNKPIVICKGGKTKKGNTAIKSHSASLAGSYSVFQAACKQSGMIEVQGLSEMINALLLLSKVNFPNGNRVLIVSNGGGMGVMLADLCERGGCAVYEPPLEIQMDLQKSLPLYYSLKNPIDITGSGTNEQCGLVLDKLLNSGQYDCLLMVILSGTEGINTEIIKVLNNSLPKNFPVVLGAYGKELYPQLREALRGKDIPIFPSGEESAWAVNLLIQIGMQASIVKNFPTLSNYNFNSKPLKNWLNNVEDVSNEMELKSKLSECGVQIPRQFPIGKSEDLSEAVIKVGYPIILKVAGKDIKHKTEMKGVRADIFNEKDLYHEWDVMNNAWPGQVWVEEQMPPGLDLIVGMHLDSHFGPVLLLGTGGKYVEIYNDVERIILPAKDEDILRAILRTRIGQILGGVRGEDPFDSPRLFGFIKMIAEWVYEDSKILSLDFNPIRLYAKSLVVLDAKITLINNFQE